MTAKPMTEFPSENITRLVVNPHRQEVNTVLADAAKVGLTDVIVIGWDRDGDLHYDSSMEDGPKANWLLDVAKKRLLEFGT